MSTPLITAPAETSAIVHDLFDAETYREAMAEMPALADAEVAIAGNLATGVALAAGGAAGWYVVTRVFDMGFAPDWGRVAATLALASAITLGIGVAGSVPALRARPARMLRTL